MIEATKSHCPECADHESEAAGLDRRGFIRVVGERTAALLAVGSLANVKGVRGADAVKASASDRPAESLVRELYAALSADQKKELVLPWNHGAEKGIPTRLGMYNKAIGKTIGESYTKPQQELCGRILRAISSGEEGYRQISRGGTFDASRSLEGCGATLFGDPSGDKPFAWVFAGHHLTVRCDGNFQDGAAFGGPIYYGHSPNGYSDKNIFNYQTKSVLTVYDSLSEDQRKKAVVTGTPGEQAPSVRFRKAGEARPGIGCADLSKQQRELVEKVMRDILSPYRKEDADEAMQVLKDTGGLDKIHLAFYQDKKMNDDNQWHFWRLEGPGFVWNYRVLPHVHTYVNIASRA